MSKTRDTGYLANVIQVHDTGVRIMSGSEMLMAISSSGAVTITGELSGSDAANSLLLNGTGSVGFTTTGSFSTASGSASSRLTQIENVYATTGSNSFRATQSITGSLTVTGQIIAQTINVQQVTSSIVYSSGSNVFGCDINSRQTFTGSVFITGSNLNATVGNACFSNAVCAPQFIGGTICGTGGFSMRGATTTWSTTSFLPDNPGGSGAQCNTVLTATITGCTGWGPQLRFSGATAGQFIDIGQDCNGGFVVEGTDNPRLTITNCGNVGIGTSSPTGGISGTETALEILNSNVGVLALTSTAASGKKYQIYSSNDGGLFFRDATCSAQRMMVSTLGNIGIGATSPVARLHTCTAYNANNIQAIFGNSNGSINSQPYDTVIIQQDDVTTFKLVERNIGSVDQVLTFSVGDSTARVSTTCALPLQFFVGGSPSACGYNGLSGRNALSIACSGISTFNYPVNMGSIGHYTNYISTSGCFAIFCASQGAILYVTSMHNNGRSTAIVSYANGVTAGAAISVVNQITPYGPAGMSFGVCANGWVYGYQQYGGPTDFYAISMNSNFVWAF